MSDLDQTKVIMLQKSTELIKGKGECINQNMHPEVGMTQSRPNAFSSELIQCCQAREHGGKGNNYVEF